MFRTIFAGIIVATAILFSFIWASITFYEGPIRGTYVEVQP